MLQKKLVVDIVWYCESKWEIVQLLFQVHALHFFCLISLELFAKYKNTPSSVIADALQQANGDVPTADKILSRKHPLDSSPPKPNKKSKPNEPETNAKEDSGHEQSSSSDFDSEEEYEVEKILKSRKKKDGTVEYLVQWANYPGKDSWEPEENLAHLNLLKKFKEEQQAKKDSNKNKDSKTSPKDSKSQSKKQTILNLSSNKEKKSTSASETASKDVVEIEDKDTNLEPSTQTNKKKRASSSKASHSSKKEKKEESKTCISLKFYITVTHHF